MSAKTPSRDRARTAPSVEMTIESDVDELPATEIETRQALLDRSRRAFAPIYKGFVQNPDRTLTSRAAPLADFVRRRDLRGLKAILFLHAIISSGSSDWSTTLPLATWARVFDTTLNAEPSSAANAVSKTLARLERARLIERECTGRAREVTVRLLHPDGSGASYSRPMGKQFPYLKLDNRYWTDGWHEALDLPAVTMLLASLHETPEFVLPTERVREWYGFSPDTAERGFAALEEHGLLSITQRTRKAPLAPTGATTVNVYRLKAPFAQEPVKAKSNEVAARSSQAMSTTERTKKPTGDTSARPRTRRGKKS